MALLVAAPGARSWRLDVADGLIQKIRTAALARQACSRSGRTQASERMESRQYLEGSERDGPMAITRKSILSFLLNQVGMK